MTKFGQNVCPE